LIFTVENCLSTASNLIFPEFRDLILSKFVIFFTHVTRKKPGTVENDIGRKTPRRVGSFVSAILARFWWITRIVSATKIDGKNDHFLVNFTF